MSGPQKGQSCAPTDQEMNLMKTSSTEVMIYINQYNRKAISRTIANIAAKQKANIARKK